MTKYLNLDIDSTLGGDNASDSVIASQRAIKSCIDNKTSGMVKKVNNISPDSSGNVTLSIPQQVQANWDETDTTSKAYIQNKPTNVSAFTNDSGYITNSGLSGCEQISNKTTSLSPNSTDIQYPSAKCVYDALQNASGGASRNIGEIVQSTIPLTDAGLHLLDGSLISGSGIYSDFVDYIANLYNTTGWYCWTSSVIKIYTTTPTPDTSSLVYDDNPSHDLYNMSITSVASDYSTITVQSSGGTTTTYTRASSDDEVSNYFCTQTDWNTSVYNYGVCGKFVYNSTNNTVRLPKITGFTESTIDVTTLGDLTEAGLPNITGAFNASQLHDGSPVATGAFGTGGSSKKGTPTSDTDSSQYGFNIDASRSSTIYGNSTTVQPQSIKVLYYIVVANTTKTAVEVDIDNVVTDLNAKLDKNLSNITASSKELITGWCIPDYENAITIANNTDLNTAVDNGFIILNLFLSSSGSAYLQINGVNVAVSYRGSSYASPCSGVFPVFKGDTFKITTTNHSTYGIYMFAPAKGVE